MIVLEIVSPSPSHSRNANDTEVELNRVFVNQFEEILRTCPFDAFPTFFVLLWNFSLA
jgi:hypothetical protein